MISNCNEKRYERAREEGFSCALSLAKAISDAGGSISSEIGNMTLKEFICKVAAQNNIRFVYEKPLVPSSGD